MTATVEKKVRAIDCLRSQYTRGDFARKTVEVKSGTGRDTPSTVTRQVLEQPCPDVGEQNASVFW